MKPINVQAKTRMRVILKSGELGTSNATLLRQFFIHSGARLCPAKPAKDRVLAPIQSKLSDISSRVSGGRRTDSGVAESPLTLAGQTPNFAKRFPRD